MADERLYTINEEFVRSEEDSSSQESDLEMTSNSNMEYEAIPRFDDIRMKLLPLIKTDAWLKSMKTRLQSTNATTESVFYKPLNDISRIDYGFTVAISCDDYQYHYVLNSYLIEWHISSLTLVQIAQANLRKKLIQDGKAWKTSRTGVRFMENVGPLAASVILLPDVIESLGGQQGDLVASIPVGELCMLGNSQSVKQICVMSEIALRFTSKQSFLSTQPLRLVKKEWVIYEADKSDDEYPFPKSEDEVKMLKRALKMQGKI